MFVNDPKARSTLGVLLTGVKLNNNRTQYSSPEKFWQCNQDVDPELN